MRKLSTLWAVFPPTFTHSPLENKAWDMPWKTLCLAAVVSSHLQAALG